MAPLLANPYLSLVLLVLGGGLGFFGGLFGIGGGIIAVPLFVLGWGMDQSLAQGTALILMVPNLLIGWWRYQKHTPLPYRAILSIAASATLTTWFAARLIPLLSPWVLRQLFGAFLGLLSLHLWQKARQVQRDAPMSFSPWALPVVGCIGGGVMGLLGIGGGLIAGPLISGWLKQRQTVAQGLSLALVAPSSLVALEAYAQAGRVDWVLGLPLAIGGFFTVSAGVALAHRLPEKQLRKAFAVMLLITAVWLILGAEIMPR